MERTVDETRVRALFRDLRIADESLTPEFARVWNKARTRNSRPRNAFKLSFAVPATLLIVALCSLALWSHNWQRARPFFSKVTGEFREPVLTFTAPAPVRQELKESARDGLRNRVGLNRRPRKPAASRAAELTAMNSVIPGAATISTWQSPTAQLMQSPSGDVMTALPQLNRSAAELESFLLNTNR